MSNKTIEQQLMFGLGQAGADWKWTNDELSYHVGMSFNFEPGMPMTKVTETQEEEPVTEATDNPEGTSVPEGA